jgi:nucleoside-diphosphate-sugar epimerase
MTQKRILLTGASGCIGHYIAESLIQDTRHELFLLVRNPDKFKLASKTRTGVNIVQADLKDIQLFSNLLKTIDVAILTATSWGGRQESNEINIRKTIELIKLLNPANLQQVIYFSTASILDRNNQLLPEAGSKGTDYIRTKYECFLELEKLTIAEKITVLFPTLVVGGDRNKPYSHLSSGLPDVVKWINLIRWFKANGSFHFIHARDIAQIVGYLIDNPLGEESELFSSVPRKLVLGNERITVNQAVEQICSYLNKKIYFRFPLPLWLANLLTKILPIQMAPWDRFCLEYRHFTYQNIVNPATFGMIPYCPTLADVLKQAGIGNEQ